MLVIIAVTGYVALLACALGLFIGGMREDLRAQEAEIRHLLTCQACRGDGECDPSGSPIERETLGT